MIPAAVAVQRPADAKLLVVDASGHVTHHHRGEFPSLVEKEDLVVANDAATLPASLSGVHLSTGEPLELRLARRESLLPQDVIRFTAVAFGAGDFRTPTEHRPPPPALAPGDVLQLGPLRAEVLRVLGHPRLIEVAFQGSVHEIWAALARHARPIQYAYVPQPLAISDTWTRIASLPVAFEAPSAGFLLDWRVIGTLRARGARFATITHAAGISSTGDVALDARLPLEEPYRIPASTARLIHGTRRRGGRIVAVGTTVCGRSKTPQHGTAGYGLARRSHRCAWARSRDCTSSMRSSLDCTSPGPATTNCCARSRMTRCSIGSSARRRRTRTERTNSAIRSSSRRNVHV